MGAFIYAALACGTSAKGGHLFDGQDNGVAIASTASVALQAAVAGGVQYAVSKDAKAEDYVRVVRTFLYEFLEADNLSAGKLQKGLNDLPIRELQTDEAKLIIRQ